MRIWLSSTVKTSAFGPSAATSIAAHMVLIGAAVYGTGVSARKLQESMAQQVFYLPPPDRQVSSRVALEHLHYLEVGAGATLQPSEAPNAKREQTGGQSPLPRLGSDVGVDDRSQAPTAAVQSDDSVYSVLDVEESAVRAEGSAAPIYPPALVKASVEGAVLTRYIVDTTGYADSTTIQVLHSTHPAFVAAVLNALPRMRFSSASVRGRRVRQIVEQNFEFKITPPVTTPAEHTRAKPIP